MLSRQGGTLLEPGPPDPSRRLQQGFYISVLEGQDREYGTERKRAAARVVFEAQIARSEVSRWKAHQVRAQICGGPVFRPPPEKLPSRSHRPTLESTLRQSVPGFPRARVVAGTAHRARVSGCAPDGTMMKSSRILIATGTLLLATITANAQTSLLRYRVQPVQLPGHLSQVDVKSVNDA